MPQFHGEIPGNIRRSAIAKGLPEIVGAHLPHFPSFYDDSKGSESALELVYMLYPSWKTDEGPISIMRFTRGLMNTVLKITKQVPGRSESEHDKEAILLRAYGTGSDILIDRELEIATHALLAERGFAAPLLGRFENGLLYKFVPGRVCTPHDLVKEPVWRAVASRLGEWHAQLPVLSTKAIGSLKNDHVDQGDGDGPVINRSYSRNIWVVLQQQVSALPSGAEDEKNRKATLQKELNVLFGELHHDDEDKFVLGHCDVLSANVIVSPETDTEAKIYTNEISNTAPLKGKVHFIDYEFAVPCPVAYDLANHFSEWGGFELDYSMLPTRATRRAFIEEYLRSFSQYKPLKRTIETEVDELLAEVDRFRGVPCFFWGTFTLIQATISSIDFDWIPYAEKRLAEFWAWRAEDDGSRIREGKEMTLRERRWAQET